MGSAVLKKFYPSPSLLASDLSSFRRQETIFVVFNLVLLSVLVFLHHLFASFWGAPSRSLLLAIALVYGLGIVELAWLQRLSKPLSAGVLVVLTWSSIAVYLALAILLAGLTDHEDSPYSVLMVVPILEAAFRFELAMVLGVVAIADLSLFLWVWLFFERHPPLEVGEYFEAGTTSLVFMMVAVVVWMLVRGLRERETSLATNLLELQRTRERLVQQERLAAVGRLSSAIAHEIRNPVAMISSSIATAKQLSGTEREEMFEIASEEASRLVRLTTDFLSYARPRPPQPAPTSVPDTLSYVVAACRAHATQKGATVQLNSPEELAMFVDAGQVQQALINLIMNAVDDALPGSTILVNAHRQDRKVCIDVENAGDPIRQEDLSRIFEPFFTTKPHGTGLGLAIARGIALAHGGDLVLSANGPKRICFSLILPVSEGVIVDRETVHG